MEAGHGCVPHLYSIWKEGFGKSVCACSEFAENDDRITREGIPGRWEFISKIERYKAVDNFKKHDDSVR